MKMREDTLKPCPFCGETPEVPEYEHGTFYEDLGCCFAYICIQISDLMTLEERRKGWDEETFRYDLEYAERAKQEAIKQWNTRAQNTREVSE